MSAKKTPATRFREFREKAGLSHDEAASKMGISSPAVWDIESFEDDLPSCYSPIEAKNFCRVLGIHPVALFGGEISNSPISANQLVLLIHEKCRQQNISLEQFENVVGWRLSACIVPPEHLLEDISIDGLQWLCRELEIDWLRVISSL
jgi:transcriptional regulator with XRE-family HTH domain